MGALGIVIILAYMLTVGWAARVFGLTNEMPSVPSNPSQDPSLFDLVGWIWDNIGAFLDLSSFQVAGVHPLASIVLSLVNVAVIWTVIRLIRGGG